MASATFKIQGMSCGHCVHAVTKALKGLPGVEDARVEIGSAVVQYDPTRVTVDKLKHAIKEQGYDVVGISA